MYRFFELVSSIGVLACTKRSLRQKTTLAPVYGEVFSPIFQTTFEINKYSIEY